MDCSCCRRLTAHGTQHREQHRVAMTMTRVGSQRRRDEPVNDIALSSYSSVFGFLPDFCSALAGRTTVHGTPCGKESPINGTGSAMVPVDIELSIDPQAVELGFARAEKQCDVVHAEATVHKNIPCIPVNLDGSWGSAM